MNSSSMGSGFLITFVDINNTIYVASTSQQQAQVWFNGSSTPSRVLPTGSNAPYGIFATINGDILVDNGNGSGRVDRWTKNSSTPIPALFVNDRCMFLFIDTYDRLYCSVDTTARVIRNSYLGNINESETIAGNGAPGWGRDHAQYTARHLCGFEHESVRHRL